jgi:putative hydrolase of the HAD superfamily
VVDDYAAGMALFDKLSGWLKREGTIVSKALGGTKSRLEADLDKRERDLSASPQDKLDAIQAKIDRSDPLAEVRSKIDGVAAKAEADAEIAALDSAKLPGSPSVNDASDQVIRAVLFDFGGVVTTSPFDAFASFEQAAGLPDGIIREINSTNPDTNAWARFERNHIDRERFVELFGEEAAALGHEIDGGAVLDLLHGDLRPEMVKAIRTCKDRGLKTACLTNNISSGEAGSGEDEPGEFGEVMALFDEIVESSKVGARKPELRFYELAWERLGVQPGECVFLDDLGVNLRPARAMGMTTIKVVDPHQAIDQLLATLT